MTQRALIAVLADARAERLPADILSVKAGRFTLVLGRQALSGGLLRRVALRRALTRQRLLEALMPAGTVLPGLPGAALDPSEAEAFVSANAPLLEGLAARLDGQVQYQLCIAWDPDLALDHFATTPGPLVGAVGLEALTDGLSAQIRAALGPVVTEACELPRRDGVAFNAALLVDAARGADLDAALEQVDRLWTEGLTLRLIGPAPAVSFASLGIRRVGRVQLRAAARLLGLSSGASAMEIQAARRQSLIAAGQGQGTAAPGVLREAAERMLRAAAHGCPDGPLLEAFIWSEGQANAAPPAALKGAA